MQHSGLVSLTSRVAAVVLLLLGAVAAGIAEPKRPPPQATAKVRVYTLDCGHLFFYDMGLFSDTGEYDGQRGAMPVPCFLIRHPKGDLMWDTGFGDLTARQLQDMYGPFGILATPRTPLTRQLAALGVSPDQVEYLALSHLHADHAGGANLFPRSTWLLYRNEIAWATATPAPSGVAPALFSAYRTAKVEWLNDNDHDVFGDGSVRILRASGHSAGHAVLMLQLARAGTVILSGDLAHTLQSHKHRRVPLTNYSRAETLASFDRVDKLIANRQGRLIVQHSPEHFAALPKPPAFLD